MNTTETYSADEFQAMQKRKDKVVTGAAKNDYEHQMQCEIVADFDKDHPEFAGLLFAIPNGAKLPYHLDRKGKRYSKEAQKLLKEGMRPGIPDLKLPVPRGIWHGLFVECKILPNQPTPEQRAMMQRLTEQGYHCQVVYTREQAQVVFAHYLSL